ncbi:phosphoglucosamine mutase [Candidatus Azobacteroides pseudotrichonymphae]|uniref:Phosphoglucomutase/phosphomannomutase n=1 Tax=Azobacteroides pseudotrichonymphae genomovar. CFP2 TaxID=511995 RepID=B6YQI3_AZOPC|nr:phosphoglucosamine mutase [Candidatus Azobacteroides pseudotrichonymphae]BAG83455.1 phosphoglucomutase/phosphomannomutase [Candidatus Azobacteroides pseudotrichonymphae genomovar. CFP2]
MPLIKSISGIRGTIGGKTGDSLSPLDVVKFTAAYASLIRSKSVFSQKIILGRDARVSGTMMRNLVISTLVGMGLDVVDIGLATTPTAELAVVLGKASGGIILTASHNSEQWNALKLLNERGELLNTIEWDELLQIAENKSFSFVSIDKLGKTTTDNLYAKKHIDHILALKLVDTDAIQRANFKVVIDAVNSVGGIIIPQLLRALGVNQIICINANPTGFFAHNPEPLPQNLGEIAEIVKQEKASIGFAVDPDVDRLAIVTETGDMFGEEYTLVSIASYVLSQTPGNTVSNISSTRALRDVTEQHGCIYTASSVGEVNVVKKMKETNAVIGGEGNGGIIYPTSHYGRDALVGIALFLTYLAKSSKKVSELRASYPDYYMVKRHIDLTPDSDMLLNFIKKKYEIYPLNEIDGIKIDFPNNCWIHFRKSNTEPILRIYAEASSQIEADLLVQSAVNLCTEVHLYT